MNRKEKATVVGLVCFYLLCTFVFTCAGALSSAMTALIVLGICLTIGFFICFIVFIIYLDEKGY